MKKNIIYNKSCLPMHEVDDQSIALMVTSPPYNVGMEYEETLTLKDYLYWLSDVWHTARKKLIPGGRFAINIANTGRNPYVPLASHITQQLIQIGMVPEGEILWLKPVSSQKSNTTFGSYRMPSNPALADRHEYILIFRKDERRRDIRNVPTSIKQFSQLSKEDFLKWRKSTWEINASARNGHPCPFPLELPVRLIQLYSFVGDTVLDVFLGSGTSAVAAAQNGRYYVGYEPVGPYCEIARQRVVDTNNFAYPPQAA